jgi:hypothetical protein
MTARILIKRPLLRWNPGIALALGVLVLYVGGSLMGQLQQSGGPGSTVQANAGTNLNTSALALETGGNLATIAGAVGSAKMNVAGTLTTVSTVTAVTAITNALPAGTNVIGHVIADSGLINTVPKTSCGNTVAAGSTLAAVPTSPTLITSAATACVVAIIANNTNAAAITITVTDNTGTPINDILTFSIPPYSQLIQPLYGAAFNAGVKWTASTTGVTGALVAYQ